MRGRPRYLSERFMAEDFKVLHKKASGPEKQRYMGLHHVQQGKTYADVADICLVKQLTVQGWVKKYEVGGVLQLVNQPGRGRKSRLKINDNDFKESILALQEERDGGRVKGQDILDMIKKKFHVTYSLSGLYKVLERRKIVWITGRSIHPNADIEAQEAFKKTSKKSSKGLSPKTSR